MTTPTLGLPTTLPPSWAVTSDASGTRTEVTSRTVRSSGWTPFASTDDIRPVTTKLDCFLDKTRLKRWDRVSLTSQMIGRVREWCSQNPERAAPAPTASSTDRHRSGRRQTGPIVEDSNGPALTANPDRAVLDAREASCTARVGTSNKSLQPVTSMYSCGIIVVFTDRSSSAGAKRTPPETSSIGIYASNKPARVGKCMIRKELEEAKAQYAPYNDTRMRMLLTLCEKYFDRSAEVEDRREDREGPLAAERAKCKEWRQKTREEAAAAIMGINDQMRRETAATVEERLQYEERFERDCNEVRQRHQELMMMLSVMQRQDSDKHC
ncbi:hypothetical protein F443_19325 [Phytophthora nicotianae P1569]|uniref:Uncharacterized protein n=1 Tax=Phytophthora nicotianae P1569 TaxID=1317065 RepID=V9E4U0_PHYNI|nr:hypothetical protein F443_19325 [Phytophthora nicotianae P1569]